MGAGRISGHAALAQSTLMTRLSGIAWQNEQGHLGLPNAIQNGAFTIVKIGVRKVGAGFGAGSIVIPF
jgi:hypothetical protein